MILSYSLKLFPNKGKLSKLNALLELWKESVNLYIARYWELEELVGNWPSKDLMPHGSLQICAANKAWLICKIAKITEQLERPIFKGNETQSPMEVCEFNTAEFDLWIKVSGLEHQHKVPFPAKRHKAFNKALSKGVLRKTAKIVKRGKYDYYAILYVEVPDRVAPESNSYIGLDVGITNTVATSDGKFYGEEVKEVRKRTKHRKYLKGASAQQQALNYVAKELIADHPDTNFVVEKLSFKGKHKRPKSFRKRHNTWSYSHLAKRLEQLGKTEGFKVLRVNPAFTSQTCPKCKSAHEENRKGEAFNCTSCGYQLHADTVGAVNVLALGTHEKSIQGK
jgi:IS605 OrfB family transposase